MEVGGKKSSDLFSNFGVSVMGMEVCSPRLLLCMAWTGEAQRQQQLSGALRLSRRNAVPCTYLAANPGSFGGGACVCVALFQFYVRQGALANDTVMRS